MAFFLCLRWRFELHGRRLSVNIFVGHVYLIRSFPYDAFFFFFIVVTILTIKSIYKNFLNNLNFLKSLIFTKYIVIVFMRIKCFCTSCFYISDEISFAINIHANWLLLIYSWTIEKNCNNISAYFHSQITSNLPTEKDLPSILVFSEKKVQHNLCMIQDYAASFIILTSGKLEVS